MPCGSKNWADEAIRISSLLSKQTTPSEEAMALTVLEKKMKYWLESPEDIPNDEDLEGFQSNMSHKKKKSRDVWTHGDIDMFYAKQIEIAKLRKDSMTGEGWDLAYQQSLSSMVSMSDKTLKKNNELLKLAFQDDMETSTVSSSIKDNDPTINTNHF